jgi:hypothetical protein
MSAHLLFGEQGGFTGQWRLSSAKGKERLSEIRVLGPSCKILRLAVAYLAMYGGFSSLVGETLLLRTELGLH